MPFRLLDRTDPAGRLAWFAAGLLLILLAIETYERRNEVLIAAASHRGLTKVAMFQKHARVDVLVLGTSRLQDGVSPDLITRGLNAAAPELGEVLGFNAAFTGSSLGALISLAPRFDGRPDVRVALIELSEPQILNEAAPWDEPARSSATPVTVEETLGEAVQHVTLIRYRKALLAANLGRLPSLWVAASQGGWETKGTEQLASWLGYRESPASGFDPALWRPEVVGPASPTQTINAELDAAAAQLAELAHRFAGRGITPIFLVPPIAARVADAPERHGLRALFSEVARRGACEVWNFAALALPDAQFRDPSHLNRDGRAHFSEALARELVRVLKVR